MRVLITLLRSLTWMCIYRRKALLAYCTMIRIVSGYNLARKSSMEKYDQIECVPTSLCKNISLSFTKESVPDLRDLVIIWEVSAVFWCSNQTVLTVVSRVVTRYESSQMMIYAQMSTGQRVVVVRHCVTAEFLTPFFYGRNVGENSSSRWGIPLLCENLRSFL